MKKINLQKIFKKKGRAVITKSTKSWPFSFARDWMIIVLIFAVVLIFLSLFSWHIYLSNKIAGGYLEPEIETIDLVTKTINQGKLDQTLLILETKQDDYFQLKTNQPKLVDPAL